MSKDKVYTNQLKRMADEVTCPEDLLTKVKNKFPNTLPKRLLSEADISRLIGQQDVIRYMEGVIDMINKS